MKKLSIIAILALAATSLNAQTMGDALTWGRTNYYGTARTLGMGNAVTAVGGDLGGMSIQPAAGAVAGYSQFEFSLGTSTTVTGAAYSPSYDLNNGSQQFGSVKNDSKTTFIFPNIAANFRFDTGSSYGLRSFNYGFAVNRSDSYGERYVSSGIDRNTSITGAFATGCAGMDPKVFHNYSNPYYDSDVYWNSLVAYGGGLVNYNAVDDAYYGSGELKTPGANPNEFNYAVPGNLYQQMSVQQSGSKNDYAFNFGMNFNDRFYLGFNLTLVSAYNKYLETFKENTGSDYQLFTVTPEYIATSSGTGYNAGDPYVGSETCYLGSLYRYEHNVSMTGINAKMGFIWLPLEGLRLGGAIQTPTSFSIVEKWGVRAGADFLDDAYSALETSPIAKNEYDFRAPWGFNLGAAWTYGTLGMISADWEVTDYSVMKFSDVDEDGNFIDDAYYRENQINKLFCGVQHTLRLGLEVKPVPFIAIRAGYNFMTCPERYYTSNGQKVTASDYDYYFDDFDSGRFTLDAGSKKYFKDNVSSLSVGLGYISGGAFYGDFAVRRTTYPKFYYSPYSAYIDGFSAPEARVTKSIVDAVVTVGWRF
ncbi:MAG: hypothetical protein J5632_04635 [Bacteroidales bacterium]|nr:hypothetical protein [Bacteroidales bacterium]